MKKIILFGGGQAGAEALAELQKENVAFICDNNEKLCGTFRYGVEIIDFERLLTFKEQYVLVIAANDQNAFQMSNQLEINGVSDYLFYYYALKEYLLMNGLKTSIHFIQEHEARMFLKSEFFRIFAAIEHEQICYIKKVANPEKIPAADGYLRVEQLKTLQFVKGILNEIEEINLHPFAIGGTLIGAIRHHGFVPWDDDIDFALSRADLMRLLQYARDNWKIVYREFDGTNAYRQINDCLRNFPNQNILVVSPYCISIINGTSIIDYCIVDFFAVDFFEEKYLYAEYKECIYQVKDKIEATNNVSDRLKFEQEAVEKNQHIVKESKHLGFSLDTMNPYVYTFLDTWLDAAIVYPTRQMEFEDTFLPVPNDVVRYLSYEKPGYKKMPIDFGISKRLQKRNDAIEKLLKKVEIYITSLDGISHCITLYQQLRADGIYAIFVIDKIVKDGSIPIFEIQEKLLQLGVEHHDYVNPCVDVAITDGSLDKLRKYHTENIYSTCGQADLSHIVFEIEDLLRG